MYSVQVQAYLEMKGVLDLETELLYLVLSDLPECPPEHRLHATASCRGFHTVLPLLSLFTYPLHRIAAIWAVGEDEEDVLRARAAAAVTLRLPGEVYLDFEDEEQAACTATEGALTLRGDCAVEGLGTVWAHWDTAIGSLCSVVLGWRVCAPGDALDHCVVGLCHPLLLAQLAGGNTDAAATMGSWEVGECLAVSSFAGGTAANLHSGGDAESTMETIEGSTAVHTVSAGVVVIAVSASELRVATGEHRFVVQLGEELQLQRTMVPFVALSTQGKHIAPRTSR